MQHPPIYVRLEYLDLNGFILTRNKVHGKKYEKMKLR